VTTRKGQATPRHWWAVGLAVAATVPAVIAGSPSREARGSTLRLVAPTSVSATCTSSEKQQRLTALAKFKHNMSAARRAYFRMHHRAKAQKAYVKKQRAILQALRRGAACTVVSPPSRPPPPAPPAPPPGPVPAPPPSPNELFDFDGIPTPDQAEITADVAYAVQDEAALLGVAITSVRTFASNSPDWLANQHCHFFGHDDDSCRRVKAMGFANGCAEGGPGAVFLNWASSCWRFGSAQNQKIVAHELFHGFQWQLDKLFNSNGNPPSNQVPPQGPVWLDEGAPETVGYHVAADRRLFPSYASALADQITSAKQISTPLSSLQTRDETNIPNLYSLFHVAVAHLVSITPAGLPALTTYLNDLGAGMTWQDAFKSAFGMTIDAYYANFAAYRAGL
jgi:hypothetical protein